LLDRVDLRVQLHPPSKVEMLDDSPAGAEPSARVAARVVDARSAAAARLAGFPWRSNSEVPGVELRRRWPLAKNVMRPVVDRFEDGRLSARGLDRVLRVSWTVADLRGVATPGAAEVEAALRLRLPGVS
jgi:magnesium chelatase family protein